MKKKPRLTIGRVAKLAGVGVETLRYYERVGIVAQPPRSDSSFREYPPEAVSRIRFVKRAQELGFSLKEISELLSTRTSGTGSCSRVSRQAEWKMTEIREKISDLQRIERALQAIQDTCRRQGKTTKCLVLEKFWNDEDRAGLLQGLSGCAEGSGCS